MANKKTAITFRSSKEFKNKIDEKAEMLNMSRTEFIETAANMMVDFDPVFINKMQNWAKSLKLPIGIVIQNFIIKRLGKRAGETKFWEEEFNTKPAAELLEAFQYTDQGPVTGEELFNYFKEKQNKKLKRENIKELQERVKANHYISDKEEEFLKKHNSHPEQIKERKNKNKELEEKYGDEIEVEKFEWLDE